MSAPPPSAKSSAVGFRAKVLMAMVLVIGGATGGALYVSHRAAEASDQARLQHEFQGEMGWQVGTEEARRVAIGERCRTLAKSVRILAALEEGEVGDLYRNAAIELRDVLDRGKPEGNAPPPRLFRATDFRFLDPAGKVIPGEPGIEALEEPWQTQLGLKALPLKRETGYVVMAGSGDREAINEVIITPIISTLTGEPAGAVVLFLPPVEMRSRGRSDMKRGILLGVRVFTSATEPDISSAMRDAADSAADGRLVSAGATPYMAFSHRLNPDSAFPQARLICLYPVAASIEQRKVQQLKIAGTGAITLACGLVASLLLSSRLSKPVERLAQDTEQHMAHRQRAEEQRDVTERKYQSIFENAIEGLCVLSPEGRFISINPALAGICGFPSPAVMLESLQETAAPLYVAPDRFFALLEEARTSGTVSNRELEMIHSGGDRVWVAHNIRSVYDGGGAGFRFEGSMEDVTERRRAADELRTLNAGLEKALDDLNTTQQQVIQQERLRALGEMASGVAHDFNNALTPILGYSELLIRSAGSLSPQELTDHLRTINTAATDAASVVSRLREFYRTNAEQDVLQPVDLNALARQVVTLTQPRWKDQAQLRGITINLVTDLAEGLAPIDGEAPALREMLTNMVFNAVDAMPAGGTITLRTRRGGGRCVIGIADTGTGMSEEVRRRCLEPFFSTKGDKGTGLGLSMCFGIVQRHHGKLDIQSEPGKGTAFMISFPAGAMAPAAGSSDAAAVTTAPPGRGSLQILVVDDEKPIRVLLGTILQREGHAVVMAEGGEEALKLFAGARFDLVITDKSMPGMNGDQLATAIKQSSPRTPVILLTGFGQFLDRSEVPDIDVIASKPISLESLREAIATATSTAA